MQAHSGYVEMINQPCTRNIMLAVLVAYYRVILELHLHPTPAWVWCDFHRAVLGHAVWLRSFCFEHSVGMSCRRSPILLHVGHE
jgi:hypothetical protein